MMAYQDGYVVSIINDGHPVREARGDGGLRTCVIPFGSEYKIRIKNPKYEYALVKVFIDDTPVVTGELVISPNSEADLERFVTDSLSKGRRFKFVELSHSDVQDPTSKKNGLIRVEIRPVVKQITSSYLTRTLSTTDVCFNGANYNTPLSCCVTNPGATVEGSSSDQKFSEDRNTYYQINLTVVIEIQLRGLVKEERPWRLTTQGVFYKDEFICTGGSFDSDKGLIVTIPERFVRFG